MVRYWDVQLRTVTKITKQRIKHHEKHGCGKNAMEDKLQLRRQERIQELRKDVR